MASSMNPSSYAAKETGKKDKEQESVNIARKHLCKLIKRSLSRRFKINSVINGIDSLCLEVNEKGQVR